MIRYTLDTNCLIDLEQSSEFAASIKRLVDAHRAGRAEVAIPAVTASERQVGGAYLGNFDRFTERLQKAGLADLPLIDPIAVFGFGFWGRGYWADQEMVDLENALHAILHPEIERNLSEFCRARGLELSTGELLNRPGFSGGSVS